MKQIDTIQFTDIDSGDEALIIIRASSDYVALCLSKKEDGDIEVVFRQTECKKLLEALQEACSSLKK